MPIDQPEHYFLIRGQLCYSCPVGHHAQEIRNRNAYDFYLNLLHRPWSNLNKPIKSPYMTSYIMTGAMFALVVNVCEIFVIKMSMTLTTCTFRICQGQL